MSRMITRASVDPGCRGDGISTSDSSVVSFMTKYSACGKLLDDLAARSGPGVVTA